MHPPALCQMRTVRVCVPVRIGIDDGIFRPAAERLALGVAHFPYDLNKRGAEMKALSANSRKKRRFDDAPQHICNCDVPMESTGYKFLPTTRSWRTCLAPAAAVTALLISVKS